MIKILIVEDDVTLRKELCILLEKYGYRAEALQSFSSPAEDVLSSGANLVLLDLNLPLYDGYHVCREIRKQSDIPVIVVTSRNSEADELMSLNFGADDFITKPYHPQILLAHIASVLKRSAGDGDTGALLIYQDITLDLQAGKVTRGEQSQELTKNEQHILSVLMKQAGKIVSRETLMNELWQSDAFVDDNTLTVNIGRLRKKLEEIGAVGYLKTKRGQGYVL